MSPIQVREQDSPAHVRLKAALGSAEKQPAVPPETAVIPCPFQRREALEVQVVDEAGGPLASVAVQIMRGDENVVRQATGPDGRTRFDGLTQQMAVQITLPETDRDSWEKDSEVALTAPETVSSGDALWSPPDGVPEDRVRTAVPGDCIASLAFEHGWLPDSLWNHPRNASLREKREDNKYILHPDDEVHIPAVRLKLIPGVTGKRYKLRRKGVPEMLRIRFLSFCNDPRRNLPYLLTMTSESGRPIEPRKGVTDKDGFLTEPIPPDAWEGVLLLGGHRQEEIHLFLGRVNPKDEISGAQARLNNLGYSCGAEDGELTDQTRAAVSAFQQDWKLPVTALVDDATKRKLEEIHLS